ncbi:rRNA adenine N(6)-methyltransferase [Quillaja saponaria]|uniref:rRNA adenine N(6)-methyltransferase n=1 Tax=Quillaja saponaria TaxID=32244 RepID=A0AAD7PFK3_QUISA|nr:rRNA adenine N(6)-methyltransferase [Quillaja saponaria]
MLRHPEYLLRLIPSLRLLRRAHTRPNRRRYPSRDGEYDDEMVRKRERDHGGNLYFYKSIGQHILTNPRVLDAIVRKSHIRPTDTVLEIGPGTGNLTLKLLEAAKKVVAIEIDERMVEVLQRRVTEFGFEDKLSVIRKDALRTEFPPFDLVVANIPYGISSPLVVKLFYGENPFRSATLLLQKEFARRLLAKPGDSEFNRLAVNVKLVAEVDFIMDVSKRDFLPCPKVDSSVVIIRPKAEVPNVDLNEWSAFTRSCFSKKNKTLGATFKQKKKVMELFRLSNMTGLSKEIAANYSNTNSCNTEDEESENEGKGHSSSCLEEGMSSFREKIIGVLQSDRFEEKRPSKLSIEELLHLLSLFNQSGIFFHDHAKPKSAGNSAFAAACNS